MIGRTNAGGVGGGEPGGEAGQVLANLWATNNDYNGNTMSVDVTWTVDKDYDRLMVVSVAGRVTWNTNGEILSGGPDGGINDYADAVSCNSPSTVTKLASYWIIENVKQGNVISARKTYSHPGVWQKPMIRMLIWSLDD